MMLLPLGTCTDTPSMVTDNISTVIVSHSRCHRGTRTGEIRLEFAAELLQTADDRRGARVAEDADGPAGHVVSQGEQQVEVAGLSLSRQQPLQNPGGPGGSLAAVG